MAYINGIQYANNALVVANPGRRANDCNIEISYRDAQGAQRNVLLRVTDSTQMRDVDGGRISCNDFYAGQRVNASFTGSMSDTTPPMARAYAITQVGTSGGIVGIDIDM